MRQIGPCSGSRIPRRTGSSTRWVRCWRWRRSVNVGLAQRWRTVEELPVLDHVQVAIDADTRLVIATGDPQLGNRNGCSVYRESGIDRRLAGRSVVADAGYHGVPEAMISFRTHANREITDWHDLNTVHRRDRARVEHTIGEMKTWGILRTTVEQLNLSPTQPPESPTSATSRSSDERGTRKSRATNNKINCETSLGRQPLRPLHPSRTVPTVYPGHHPRALAIRFEALTVRPRSPPCRAGRGRPPLWRSGGSPVRG